MARPRRRVADGRRDSDRRAGPGSASSADAHALGAFAINAMLATEPGITARTKLYFIYSQLPGALFFNDLNGAMLFNYILGLVVGGLWWFIAERRSRRNATQIVGPQRG